MLLEEGGLWLHRASEPISKADAAGEMADAGQRIKCLGCRKVFDVDAATVGENFGRNKHGEFYSRRRACKETNAEQSKIHYVRNKETYAAYAKAYKEAHRGVLYAAAREKVACELCGCVVCRDKMMHHQNDPPVKENRPVLMQAP